MISFFDWGSPQLLAHFHPQINLAKRKTWPPGRPLEPGALGTLAPLAPISTALVNCVLDFLYFSFLQQANTFIPFRFGLWIK